MASCSGVRRAGRLAVLAMAAFTAGQAGAAMPGLYFAGFYMDSSLAYATVDARVADFDLASQGLWDDVGGVILEANSAITDDKDIGYGFGVGYQFTEYLAMEFSYFDMGTVHYQSRGSVTDGTNVYSSETFMSAKSKGPLLAGIGIWPLGDHFSLDARAGVFLGRTRLRGSLYIDGIWLTDVSDKDNKTSVMLGAGVNWAMSPGTAIRAGYTRLRRAMVSRYDVSSWMLSLKYAW